MHQRRRSMGVEPMLRIFRKEICSRYAPNCTVRHTQPVLSGRQGGQKVDTGFAWTNPADIHVGLEERCSIVYAIETPRRSREVVRLKAKVVDGTQNGAKVTLLIQLEQWMHRHVLRLTA